MLTTDFDILLPCYNPLPGWERTVVRSFESLQQRLSMHKIGLIIVNDGTQTNNWISGASELKLLFPEVCLIEGEVNLGKGHALREGLEISKASHCLFTDIDFPYTEESFISVFETLMSGEVDVVIGQRPPTYYANVPLPRVLLSKCFRIFLRFIYGFEFRDSQCGLKAFNERGRALFLTTKTNRYLVDLEFLLLASSHKLAVRAVSVELRPDVVFSKLGLAAVVKEMRSLLSILVRVFVSSTVTKLSAV